MTTFSWEYDDPPEDRMTLSEPLLRCGGWLIRRITTYADDGTIAEREYAIVNAAADRKRGDDWRGQCTGWHT